MNAVFSTEGVHPRYMDEIHYIRHLQADKITDGLSIYNHTNNCVVSRFVLHKGEEKCNPVLSTKCSVLHRLWNLDGKREISNFLLVHRYVIAFFPQYPDPVTLSPRVFTPLLGTI